MFHAIVVGKFIYVPGASGTLHKIDRQTGHAHATIRLAGVGSDPDTYVAGGISSDARGNLYYNALALEPGTLALRGAWLVKVRPDDTGQLASYASIVPGAPAATDLCVTQFSPDQLPWPPSPDAVPPSLPCGGQRPVVNVTPAVGDDGTVVTVATAHRNSRYAFAVAVHADLTPKWTASLRGILSDGCSVTTPSDATADTTDPRVRGTHCRVGPTTASIRRPTRHPPAWQPTGGRPGGQRVRQQRGRLGLQDQPGWPPRAPHVPPAVAGRRVHAGQHRPARPAVLDQRR